MAMILPTMMQKQTWQQKIRRTTTVIKNQEKQVDRSLNKKTVKDKAAPC